MTASVLSACDGRGRDGVSTKRADRPTDSVLPGPRSDIGTWMRPADTPDLALGPESGSEPFHGVRDAVLLDSGGVVVANGGNGTLMYFDAEGHPVTTAGGSGGGPAEFQVLGEIARAEGGLVAFDRGADRFNRYDRTGSFLEGVPIRADDLVSSSLDFEGINGSRRAVLASSGHYDAAARDGIHTDTVSVLAFPLDGGPVDTLGAFPGSQTYVATGGPDTRSVQTFPRVFSGRVHVAAGDSTVAVAAPRAPVVHLFMNGEPRREIHWEAERRTVDEEAEEKLLESIRAQNDGPRGRRLAERFRRIPLPDRMPAIGGLVVDDRGRIWIGEYVPPYSDEPQRWLVVSPRGEPLGTVTSPGGFTLTDVRDGRMVGLSTDEVDLIHLEVLALERPSD